MDFASEERNKRPNPGEKGEKSLDNRHQLSFRSKAISTERISQSSNQSAHGGGEAVLIILIFPFINTAPLSAWRFSFPHEALARIEVGSDNEYLDLEFEVGGLEGFIFYFIQQLF